MKYSLDCYIKTDNTGIRNAVKHLIPSIDDPRVWDGQYDSVEVPDDEDGIMVFSCMVRFNTEADRTAVTASVRGAHRWS